MRIPTGRNPPRMSPRRRNPPRRTPPMRIPRGALWEESFQKNSWMFERRAAVLVTTASVRALTPAKCEQAMPSHWEIPTMTLLEVGSF